MRLQVVGLVETAGSRFGKDDAVSRFGKDSAASRFSQGRSQ